MVWWNRDCWGQEHIVPTNQLCDRFEDVQGSRGDVARPEKFDAMRGLVPQS